MEEKHDGYHLLWLPQKNPHKSPNEKLICVDMRKPNLAIKSTQYIIPTLDDLIVELNGTKVFLKLDLIKGYNQLVLSERLRNITFFTMHAGLFRY